MRLLFSALAAMLPTLGLADALSRDPVVITTTPVLIERMPDGQHLNFDLTVANGSEEAIDIDRIELSVFNRDGALVLRRFVDGNGVRPSIGIIGERRIAPGQRLNVFNPFDTLAAELPVSMLRYDFELSNPDGSRSLRASVQASPRDYRNHAAYHTPLAGRFINYDGHDALGHHRRFDVEFAPIKAMGFKTNAMRYSYDFVPVDATGDMYRGEFGDNTAWFGFGAAVRAIGDGTVVAVENAQADNRQFDQSKLAEDKRVLFGNYVIIDHGGGEFGVYAHARQGSVTVKPGDRVRRDQTIAAIGASGSAFFPHLHFQLQDGPTLDAEGLPSYFQRFERVLGKHRVTRKQASIDTGEIVLAD